jgi:3-mercaptopyruvate sulfurtransferase SseA
VAGFSGFAAIVWLLSLGCQPNVQSKHAVRPGLQLPNEHGLVTVEWLKSTMDRQQPSEKYSQPNDDAGNPNRDGSTYDTAHEQTNDKTKPIVIVEASWADLANAKDYHRGHIPGAIHVNTDLFENGYPEWKLQPLESLQKSIGDLGIAPDTMVIVYSVQLIAATRVWWVLMYAGVADVRILDGDARTWSQAGFDLEQTPHELPPVAFVANPRTDWLIETADLRKLIKSNGTSPINDPTIPPRLFDMRSQAEFAGEISGYSYLDAKGRIPTASWLGDADDSSLTYKLTNGRLRPPREIYTEWHAKGLDLSNAADSNTLPLHVFYCGGGWRSSAAFFYAWLSGARNIRNYADGWAGWSTRYIRDETATGNTPGWSQIKTDHPVESADLTPVK